MRKNRILIISLILTSFMSIQSFAANFTNSELINTLPTSDIKAGKPLLLERTFDSFLDMKESVRTDIKKTAKELQDVNNYETAKNIYNYVYKHMKYENTERRIDYAWRNGTGNCRSYGTVTASLLYYAGIPNAYIKTDNHICNLALCNGKWVVIDSQSGFDISPSSIDQIQSIYFMNKHCMYQVYNLQGPKLIDVGEYKDLNGRTPIDDKYVRKNGIVVPSWTTSYLTDWYAYFPNITIRGEKGTVAEKMARQLKYTIKYSGSKFTAKPAFGKTKIYQDIKGNKVTITLKSNSKATKYQVRYSPYNSMKNCKYKTSKKNKFTIKGSIVRKGFYLQARVCTKNGFEEWSPKAGIWD